jgi:hypothetical protein
MLLPIVDLAMSEINDYPCMGYYEEVAKNTNMSAFGKKNRGGTRGHLFVLLMLRNYSSGMGLCVGI